MSGVRLIAAMCFAQVLGLLGFATFAALLPTFIALWRLSNTEAGWLSGIFYGGYMVAVPVLVALTDRRDARAIFLFGSAVSALSLVGFALAADGMWSALVWRFLAGVGFAGVYMPGLKALTDRTAGADALRAVAFYTASTSFGGGLSYYVAGVVAEAAGWPTAFMAGAAGAAAALLVGFAVLRPAPPGHFPPPDARLLDFRPVFANRRALGYILAYGCHSWELFTFTSWVVAFLAYVRAADPGGMAAALSPTALAALVSLLALPASVGGNEAAMRIGRRRTVRLVMVVSGLVGCTLGFAASLSYWTVAGLCLLYGVTTAADSASVTAGAVSAAAPERRGATMAVHSTVGFAGGFVGPFAAGVALDLAGGVESPAGWGAAFAVAGGASLLGPLMLALCRRD